MRRRFGPQIVDVRDAFGEDPISTTESGPQKRKRQVVGGQGGAACTRSERRMHAMALASLFILDRRRTAFRFDVCTKELLRALHCGNVVQDL